MLETPPSSAPDDDDDDTVQGVARRGERLRAEAARLQQAQNEAAGMTTPADPNAPAPAPAEAPTEPKPTPRKPSGA